MQVKGVTDLGDAVSTVLEVGPGAGFFKMILGSIGYSVKTADIDPAYQPDYLGDIREHAIESRFDITVAFEVLQHMPYDDFAPMMKSLASLSERYVFISLPSRVHSLRLGVGIPNILGPRRLGLGRLRGWHQRTLNWEWPRGTYPSPETWRGTKDYWKPHYWEAGRKTYPKKRILRDIESAGLRVVWHRHNPAFPHHWFIVAEKETEIS
jgi:hypothetical protein